MLLNKHKHSVWFREVKFLTPSDLNLALEGHSTVVKNKIIITVNLYISLPIDLSKLGFYSFISTDVGVSAALLQVLFSTF